MILQGKRVALPWPPVVHKQFEGHAGATPDAVAVFCAGQQMTYSQLNAQANRFAHFLTARGHGRGTKVGVCLDYSIDMVVAILGTLKAGAAYVPFDPSYPAARLQLLLGQVPDLALIVASPATAELVESAVVEVIDLGQLSGHLAGLPVTGPDVPVTGDDVCYAVFTSGSTGMPKVTEVRHEGWFNLLNWLTLEYGLHAGSHNLVVSAFGFDLSQRSLMMPLFCGATQYLMASRNFDAAMAYRMLTQYEIRVVNCASSTLYLLVDWETARGGDALTRLDYMLFGGEPLQVERLTGWARREETPARFCTSTASPSARTSRRRTISPTTGPGNTTSHRSAGRPTTPTSTSSTSGCAVSGRGVRGDLHLRDQRRSGLSGRHGSRVRAVHDGRGRRCAAPAVPHGRPRPCERGR